MISRTNYVQCTRANGILPARQEFIDFVNKKPYFKHLFEKKTILPPFLGLNLNTGRGAPIRHAPYKQHLGKIGAFDGGSL